MAKLYFEDGSVESACPPIRALLHIMVNGDFEGMTLDSPELRAMFSRDAVLKTLMEQGVGYGYDQLEALLAAGQRLAAGG